MLEFNPTDEVESEVVAAWTSPCRDPLCSREDLHPAHGAVSRASRTQNARVWHLAPQTCPHLDADHECAGCEKMNKTLGASIYAHVGTYVVVAFPVLCLRVWNDYGDSSERAIHRALARLVDVRLVASIPPGGMSKATRRLPKPSGWYIRYNSPKLWSPGGLADLMSSVDDQGVVLDAFRKGC